MNYQELTAKCKWLRKHGRVEVSNYPPGPGKCLCIEVKYPEGKLGPFLASGKIFGEERIDEAIALVKRLYPPQQLEIDFDAPRHNTVLCSHCQKDPGPKTPGSIVWRGFIDNDTGQLVCSDCRARHYQSKFKNPELRGLYSELPVIISQRTA